MANSTIRKVRARLRLWRKYGIHRDNVLAQLVLGDIGERIWRSNLRT